MDDLRTTIGSEIRKARKQLALTQEQVAALAGISSEFYARIERKHALPSVLTMYRITQVLGISNNTVLGIDLDDPERQPEPPPLLADQDPPVIRRLLTRLARAPRNEFRVVTAFMKEIDKRHQASAKADTTQEP